MLPVVTLVLLAALTFPQGDCASWARLVESVEALPAEQQQWGHWLAESDSLAKRYILSARNWLASGKTGAQAWRECESV